MPCDYDAIFELIRSSCIREMFTAMTEEQKRLGRILVLSDSAHSIGAEYFFSCGEKSDYGGRWSNYVEFAGAIR